MTAITLNANALKIPLADESVQCVVTSPPYWGLRNYNVDGQLGLESTPEEYAAHLVEVFREVRRVLRGDGTVFLNLGDCYAGNGPISQKQTDTDIRHATVGNALEKAQRRVGRVPNLKPKDLVGIPWRVAFALQADGWYLRSDIIWAKGISFCDSYSGSCMPESVRDRPTKAHEYLFLLSKSAQYFYDIEAVREIGGDGSDRWGDSMMQLDTEKAFGGDAVIGQKPNRPMRTFEYNGKRNIRTVWTITDPDAEFARYCATQGVDLAALITAHQDGQRDAKDVFVINPGSFPGAHFATFPPALVTPCIKAGTSERGCCLRCKAPWKRIIKSTNHKNSREPAHVPNNSATKTDSTGWQPTTVATNNWQPTCTCDAGDPIPCTVLDPFAGSGTTGRVCVEYKRDYIGLELNYDYVKEFAQERVNNVQVRLFE